ncbi:MAG: short-chain dehydrogenase [Deltaproteobacteria bacterium HGW-Deltaproteobacteria-13]|jgi:NAD(P)-dependent dehydrogenase (short-subunit alcohol dehydrogenase family)|nr:MAG: short-chain dehydrogenase [Deltaproteobacteria bacterium HGW-Deltaproteobacteria-13]
MDINAPVVLISGCSSGIGRALTLEFAARNCRVFATARKLSTINDLKAQNVEISALDVTDEKSIAACVDSVIAKAGRIDMLVNNAGLLLIGPLVELETNELRRQFETNVIGQAALIRAVAPHMIGKRSGKIVNMSSVSGVLPTPFAGAYCSTKAAFTAFSDSLRMELAPFGITVVIVQPGGIKSNLSDNADKGLERFRKTPFGPIQDFIIARANASQENATPAEDFAKKLVDKLMKEKTPKFIRLGKDSTLLPVIARFPRAFVDALLSKKFGLDRLR